MQNELPVDAPFPSSYFERADPSADSRFYETPRLVTYIDDGAIAIIGEVLRELIPPDATILDLMSSWKSHLPPEVTPRRVVGLGMNAVELMANEQLDEWIVQDINADPMLPFADNLFDIAIITVSIQYVVRPVSLFRDAEARGRARRHLLEPALPHQGGARLVRAGRRGACRPGDGLFRAGGRLR